MHSKFLKKTGAVVMSAALAVNGLAIGGIATSAEGAKYEFEDAVITGDVTVENSSGASGGKCLKMTDSGTISIDFEVEEAGAYDITVYAGGIGGNKQQDLSINGNGQGALAIPSSAGFEAIKVQAVPLKKGTNTMLISKSWGWSNFDYFTVESVQLPDIKASQTSPCDIKAIPEVRSLMDYLSEVYGNGIISGQQEIYSGGPHGLEYEFEYLNDLTGHYPAIRGFDYGNFCCPAYGSDDGSTDRIIDWVKGKNGIATASFHLNVPNDFESYTIGSRIDWSATTYGPKTDFSPSKASTPGTKDNEYYLQSLDILAKEFLELQEQGIPVLWRPLHEAEGAGGETGSWFWWGREGSEAYKKLWIYTYDVLTNEYGCHNLIWEWNSYNFDTSVNWYPGDNYVDIIGYDKYSGNTGSASSIFYGIMEKYDSSKMVAMAENDSFSTVENLTNDKAGWLYFCTWYDGGSSDINFLSDPKFNTKENTIAMYQSEYCVTLDELPKDLYTRNIVIDPSTTTTSRTTTTMTTTTTDPSQFVFEQKSYKIELPDDRTTMTVEIDGAATASIGGGLGYGTNADDWVNIDWSGNADSTGKLVVELDISDIPASIKTAEFQIWWSNVWNAATESATDKDCNMVDYTFGGSAPADVDYGDANEDGTVNLADAILIMQHKANPAKYEISEQGALNADVFDPGDGITNRDALAIQGYLLGLTEKLPVYGKDVVSEI